ncbi:TetR/AcrR family transcriptional regulator [Bradyrhizobium sp. LHD-71]|uniref:TetR/AcrR family transcriptional regulator n=1 Tax=Bradyrhizobium sp. LHD-71 TaxID=3072141 RepID=UPI00280EC891|nr:TetR/AcrR family transcriptional regulator [Bradyrhizobium sp. LHD-71]MDQ8729060.1 TetR/AcrR family transcriptional regulator [Bradyrhizobium sp. LHD-71]
MGTANRTSPARGKAGAETRAGRSDWIDAGLSLLGSAGIEAVRVEPLAVTLGVTKGSFYWHFKDRDALHLAMLEAWRTGTTANAIERVEKESAGKGERLKRLISMAAKNTKLARLEVAIRAWARTDERVAKSLAEVDRQRVDYLVALLRDAGINARSARLRAQILYLTLVGGFFTEIGKSAVSDEALWSELERLIVRPS